MTKEQKYRKALETIEDKMFRDISSNEKIDSIYSILELVLQPRKDDSLIDIKITLDAETVLEEMIGCDVGQTYSEVICNMSSSYATLLKQFMSYKEKIADRSECLNG